MPVKTSSVIGYLVFFLIYIIAGNGFAQNFTFNKGKPDTKKYFTEIPVEFIKDKLIVPVIIEGRTYRFLLDTGAPNIISIELQETLGLQVIHSLNVTDANSKREKLNVVYVPQIKLGGVGFNNTPTLVYNLNDSPVFKCYNIDGLIGSNLLRNSVVQFDKKQKRLILSDSRKSLNLKAKAFSKIEFVDNQSSPYLWVDLQGKNVGKAHILIDTGADGLFDACKKHYTFFKTKEVFNVLGYSNGVSALGLFGNVPQELQYKLLLPKLIVNNVTFYNVITETNNDNNSRLGAELLDYGKTTIDFKSKRFYFEAYWSNVYNTEKDFGFSATVIDNKLAVGFVWDENLKSQLSHGDVIKRMNNTEINELALCYLVNGELDLDTLDVLELEVESKKGDTIVLTLRKKDYLQELKDID